jgi:hypothetical protein
MGDSAIRLSVLTVRNSTYCQELVSIADRDSLPFVTDHPPPQLSCSQDLSWCSSHTQTKKHTHRELVAFLSGHEGSL